VGPLHVPGFATSVTPSTAAPAMDGDVKRTGGLFPGGSRPSAAMAVEIVTTATTARREMRRRRRRRRSIQTLVSAGVYEFFTPFRECGMPPCPRGVRRCSPSRDGRKRRLRGRRHTRDRSRTGLYGGADVTSPPDVSATAAAVAARASVVKSLPVAAGAHSLATTTTLSAGARTILGGWIRPVDLANADGSLACEGKAGEAS
jgi:hypothetical protein